MTTQVAPAIFATKGFGVLTTATLLITAATTPPGYTPKPPSPRSAAPSNPGQLRERSGRCPNRGRDRQGNWALHQIALVRLSTDPRTKAYAATHTAGKTKKGHPALPQESHRPVA